MIRCPYCEAENDDGEAFCTECGRPLKKTEKKKKVRNKYERGQDGRIYYPAQSQIPPGDDCEGCLTFPVTQSFKGGKWELSFDLPEGCSLSDYLLSEDCRNTETLIRIGKRVLAILEAVQESGRIAGSCDTEDFYLAGNEPDNMTLRVVRPLFSEKRMPEDYTAGELAAPEVRNKNEEYIGDGTDVYLAGIIINRLLIRNRYTAGDPDSQLFWGYTLTNGTFDEAGKRIRRFHHWLGVTLNMYPEKRKRTVKDAREAFDECCVPESPDVFSKILIEDYLETNVGSGKQEIMEQEGRAEAEWNEDSIEKWEKDVCGETVKAYLLADGISNCDVGSGYLASNLVRESFLEVLEETVDDSFEDVSIDMIEDLAFEIVRRSNRRIWEKACEYETRSGAIMGSTFVFIFVFEGVVYTYSLGDSPLYLIRAGNAIPLYTPDNTGHVALKSGMSFTEYRSLEGKDSLALYIGGEYAAKESAYYRQKPPDVVVLKEGDLIFAASDGVLDYLGENLSDTSWDREAELVKLVSGKEDLAAIAHSIIENDNSNGGGDNLSMILIKAGGTEHE